jgi:hypothetical protein
MGGAPQQQQGFGGMAGPMGMGGMMNMAPPAAGSRPTRRNPMMLLLLSTGMFVVGQIFYGSLGGVLGGLAALGQLAKLVGWIMLGLNGMKMTQELKAFTGDQTLNPIFAWVPCLNIYFFCMLVPAVMARAKQQAGSQVPVRGLVVYLFLPLFAYASDLNDIAG